MQYLLNLATGIGLGVMISSPALVVLTIIDMRDRRAFRRKRGL